jgi:hypothetical protein
LTKQNTSANIPCILSLTVSHFEKGGLRGICSLPTEYRHPVN